MLAQDIDIADIDSIHWLRWYTLAVPSRIRAGLRWAVVLATTQSPSGTGDGNGRHGLSIVRVLRHETGDPGLTGQSSLATVPAASVPSTNLSQGNEDIGNLPQWVSANSGSSPDTNGELGGTSAAELRHLATALNVEFVLVIESDAFTNTWRQIHHDLRVDDDLLAQGLTYLRSFKRIHQRGLWTYPDVLALVPDISYAAVQRTFDLLAPDNTSAVFYVMEDSGRDIHTSLIAVKRRGDICRVATHRGLQDQISADTLARDWRREYRRVVEYTSQRYAPVSLAVFIQRSALERILTGPSEQMARELAARNLIIDPMPAWLLGLLGSATAAAVAGRGARMLSRMLPSAARKVAVGFAQTAAHTAQNFARHSGAHPFDVLGFDPIELWLQMRHLYRPRAVSK